MTMTKRRTKKYLAARIICSLVLGAYLVGGHSSPVAWGATASNASVNVTEDSTGDASSAWGADTKAEGYASTAFGWSTEASGKFSTAFGGETNAIGQEATTFGYATTAKGVASTAFGALTMAIGDESTAFGDTTEARGENATAWGLKAKAYGVNSTSLGYNTVAGGDGATAFGGGAMALGFYSTAWGYYTQAGQLLYGSDKKVAYIVDYIEGGTTKYKIVDYNNPETTLKGDFSSYWEAYKECDVKDAVQATAWGAGTKALAGNATAFGNGSIASGIRSTAFGWFTEASGEGSTTWGIDSVASGNGATAWGGYTAGMNQVKGGTASGDASTAFGVETIANTKGSTAWGDQTLAGKATIGGTEYSGTYATAFGYGTKASGTYATAFGSLTTASGPVATAWGIGTKASGNRSTAFGDNTTASGFAATAWGTLAIASGDYSTAFGSETTASGKASTAFGIYTEATGKGAVAWGVGEKGVGITLAHGESSTAFGKKSRAFGDNSLAALGGITGVGSIASLDGVTWVNFVPGTGEGAVAIGEGATAEASYTYAIGKNAKVLDAKTENAIAIGNDTSVTAVGGVALGSKAVASVDKDVAGYDPSTGATSTDTSGAWKSTHAAISIGTADGSVTRQITGVAAGSKDTDAVNVAQLKAAADAKLDKTEFNTYKAETAVTISTMNTAIKKNADDISDLQTGKLDKAVYEADKADTKAALDGKANVALDNITDAGKNVVRKLAKESVKTIAGDHTTVTEGTDGNATTYAVNVVTDGAVASGDTGVVAGGTVYSEVRPADGTYVKATNTTAANLGALDKQVDQNAKDIKTNADGIKDLDGRVTKNTNDIADLKANSGADMTAVNHRISNLDSKVNKVGAGAAALAALHPLDTDNKFTMAAGFGNYRNANAMALGMFYRPTDTVMFSVGGAMGNGENMINAGVSFALDKGVGTSKAAMARTIKAQGDRIAEQDAKIQSLEAYNAKLEERLAALEAKIGE